MTKHLYSSFALSALIALALAISACGSSDGGGSGDEDQISTAIERVTTGSNPGDCKKLETQAFMEQNTQAEGAKAVSECELHLKDAENNPKSVAVSKVSVDGKKATAAVAFTGGGFDGQVAIVALVKEGGQWKLDKTMRFAVLNRAKLAKQFEIQLTKPANKISKSVTSCFLKAVENDPQPKVEELVLSGSAEATTKLIKSCE